MVEYVFLLRCRGDHFPILQKLHPLTPLQYCCFLEYGLRHRCDNEKTKNFCGRKGTWGPSTDIETRSAGLEKEILMYVFNKFFRNNTRKYLYRFILTLLDWLWVGKCYNHPQKLWRKPPSPSFNVDFLSFRPARCTRQPWEQF